MKKRFRLKGSVTPKTKTKKRTRLQLNKPKLMIVDGHSQLYRAFYSKTPDMSMGGIPTKVIFMFLRMLFATIKDMKPTHLVVTFDGPTAKLWRTDIYPDYKGTRDHTGEEFEDFFKQVAAVKEILTALGITQITGVKEEADDLIASIAKRAELETDLDTVIISRDKDIEQIVSKRAIMFDPQNETYRTVKSITEARGFGPGYVARYLAIAGDTTDNIPGVKGIGEVGATKLLLKYNSIGGIYQHLKDMSVFQRGKFEEARDKLPLYMRLVTLNNAVQLPFSIEDLVFKGPDYDTAKPLLKRYGFRKLSS